MRWTSPSTPVKLAARGVSAAQVASALQQATVVQSVGSLKQGTASIPLQVAGSLTSLDQIASFVVVPAGRLSPTAVTVAQLGTVRVLEELTKNALRVEHVPEIQKMRITATNVEAESAAAGDQTMKRIRRLIPARGYALSAPANQSSSPPRAEKIGFAHTL